MISNYILQLQYSTMNYLVQEWCYTNILASPTFTFLYYYTGVKYQLFQLCEKTRHDLFVSPSPLSGDVFAGAECGCGADRSVELVCAAGQDVMAGWHRAPFHRVCTQLRVENLQVASLRLPTHDLLLCIPSQCRCYSLVESKANADMNVYVAS